VKWEVNRKLFVSLPLLEPSPDRFSFFSLCFKELLRGWLLIDDVAGEKGKLKDLAT
jgi:hypothetical protein